MSPCCSVLLRTYPSFTTEAKQNFTQFFQLRSLPRRHGPLCQFLGPILARKSCVNRPSQHCQTTSLPLVFRQHDFACVLICSGRYSIVRWKNVTLQQVMSSSATSIGFHFHRKLQPRRRVMLLQIFYKSCRRHPDVMKHHMVRHHKQMSALAFPASFDPGSLQVGRVCEFLGPSFAPHFTPSYNPWDQRVCLLPNGDLMQV